MSGCLTRDREDAVPHQAWSGFSPRTGGVPALGPAKLYTHVRRADLGRRLQEARDEAQTAGQQLAAQAMVRPGPPHVDV